MNEFSLVCRILGTLFYRLPNDPVTEPLFQLIKSGKLKQNWPLEQDELLERLQRDVKPDALLADYRSMFDVNGSVPPYRSHYTGENESGCRAFLSLVGMTLTEKPADHFGLLLLAASWIEDHSAEDEIQAQLTLFDEFLLPWFTQFLGKVEAHAVTPFYRTLAIITRETLIDMRDELGEIEDVQTEGE